MRITSGSAKGRKLNVPKGNDIRPTTDKVRQAIFNILLSYDLPVNANIIDMFCGSGALGLEGLSRGASHAILIDRDTATAKDNAQDLGFADQTTILRKDATKIGTRPETMPQADLVFADPPYNKDLLVPSLTALKDGGWLTDDAVIIAETEKQFDWPQVAGFTLQDRRLYGDCRIHILTTE
ncbi:MAG TPA: 16S rRNA (guanine(966)-N(2))-methyltransferase RsmD [Micavibrio sp.]|nr:16S rRNA (guanine(966)-N(2))-methyltransferase RsmD [Micavibrio sp.]HIL28134.1 16S rRNA (guanine(966)-N(2))-methyltransferase RsmD [Micavibrio sp.]|tara:strand:- start:240 stop:782 length:543 start_codon:yes stop_codon:yes gene_type:complete